MYGSFFAKTHCPSTLLPANQAARAFLLICMSRRWFVLVLVAGVGVLALIPGAVCASEPSFFVRHPFGTGNDQTWSVAVGDLNGDGALDLVTASHTQNKIYLNNGAGNFTNPGSNIGSVDAATESVAVGDVDGDGDLDIIAGNNGQQNVVYLNDGTGDFTTSVQFGSINDNHTNSVAVGDVDGDGDLDVITGSNRQNVVYFNDGTGNFQNNIRNFGSDNNWTNSVAVGDIDSDGDLDIITGNLVQNVVYLNDGAGNFQSDGRNFGTSSAATASVAIGDVDGDGDLDIITGNSGQSLVYLNDGAGNFSSPGRNFGTNKDVTTSVAVGDVDNDGDLDIIPGNYGQNVIYLNDGAGQFQSDVRNFSTNNDTTNSVAVGDVDGDGDLDIIKGNNDQQNVVYLNNGAGHFPSPGRNFGTENDWTSSVAVGDMDGDGDLDIITGNLVQNVVYFNDGSGHFPSPGRNFGTNTTGANRVVAVGDVDNDGDLDIITGNLRGQNVVYFNDGAGQFTNNLSSNFGTGKDWTSSVAVGDVDGDGDLDIITGNGYEITGSGYEQNVVYLNNGAGQFQSDVRNFGTSSAATESVAVGDVDGDGDLDIITGSYKQNMVYLNDGSGQFLNPGRNFGPGDDHTESVVVGDVDNDGDLDIITGNVKGQNVVYLNDGTGNFPSPGRNFGTGNDDTYSMAVGDMDGDGDLDIITGNVGQDVVYFNDGAGNFPSPGRDFGTGNDNTYSVAVGDVDGDGALDIVTGNNGQNVIYLNHAQRVTGLANSSIHLSVARPLSTANADFLSSPFIVSSRVISIPYTLFAPEGNRVGRIEALYSLNGGGQWLPAVAASGTVTQNMATGGTLVRAYLSPALSIPISANSPFQARLQITQQMSLAEVEVWVSITGTQNSNLSIALRSPQGIQVPLITAGQAQGQNFQGTRFSVKAATSILSGAAPYIGIYQPVGNLAAFAGTNSSGDWTLVITNTGTTAGELQAWGLRLSTPPVRHTFYWDTFASGFFGQSDNVVVRLIAYTQSLKTSGPTTGAYLYTNTVPGPYQYPYVSATTFPFRVRGTQVRVVDSQNKPVSNALVYRLPRGAVTGAEPMPSASQPLTTVSNGYLGGRGALAIGDQLVAMAPITHNLNYTLYATSGIPNEDGLTMSAISQAGVQTLHVSQDHPLLLFDLDVSLEWDASNDGLFYQQLTTAFERASTILYDVSDGQIALGEVRIHPNREAWLTADVVIYANNNLRPRASMGGMVDTAQDEPQGLRGDLPNAYLPGQVRMGPVWDPFGQNNAELTQDWQRALAHELAHYLLFLPDNYLGVENGLLRITDCQGSVMTDAYNPGYSEFLTPSQWRTPANNPCLRTVAASLLTGRSDWETVTHFYPKLHIPSQPLQGPALLPLNVTRVRLVAPTSAVAQPVAARNYDLRDETGRVTVLRQAQAYVLQSRGTPITTDDALLYLGSTGVASDRILVHGALAGNKVCVIDSASNPIRTGCTTVTPQSTSVQVLPVPGWRPDIEVTPITSTTFQITVMQSVSLGQLHAQLLPAYGPVGNAAAIQSVSQPLTPVDATHYTTLITTAYPVFEGFVRVYEVGSPEQQQAITRFFLADPWGPNAIWRGGANRAWGANIRSLDAPAASGDGKVTILNLTDLLADTGSTVLQVVTDLPYLPAWLTPVGAGYRFAANSTLARTIMVQYNQRDVPPGYEQSLNLYYLPTGSTSWQRLVTGPLATGVDRYDNLATASMPSAGRGEGIYALIATVELPPLVPGWNPINYPIGTAQSVTNSLASLDDAFTTVYEYQPGKSLPWPLYDRTVEPAFAPLVNTLYTMVLGHNYLIYATRPVTPYIGVVGDGQAQGVVAAGQAAGLLEPPATFYGVITGQAAFSLQAGMTVQAKIRQVVCGESQLQLWQGQLAYVIQVKADTGDGCGRPSEPVVFEINGNPWTITVPWDNRHVNPSTPGMQIYLPAIVR